MLPRVIVWLVRDTCRVNDNPALRLACLNSKSEGAGVVPLACLEPRRWHSHQMGLPRIGVQWMKFRLESLEVLRHGLEELGSAIWVSEEEPIDAIVGLSRRFSILRVITDNPLSTEERFENAQIKDGGFDVVTMTTDDLFDVSQLPFEMADLPDTFSKFRRSIEKNSTIEPPSCCACPNIPSVEKYAWRDPPRFNATRGTLSSDVRKRILSGGTENALLHWSEYLESKALSHYKITRNSFSGLHQSSRLSAWLAHGCVSVRQIWHDSKIYEEKYGANESTYWLRFELLWREYFHWYARARDWTLFRLTGPEDRAVAGDRNAKRFGSWVAGSTGCDIVDAGIRELNATGWVSNRARQLMASHLIYQLNIDWRLGASYFESKLIDYDVASNWGNWAYIAGVGPDPRGGRIFDLESQAERYDPQRQYREYWLAR